ncbi:peroxisomal N(1)-acetyl-spermine/spermidine oxidase-like [Lytechinus pictus]|uniref:peroxisomal N(1)-acetyl-spermine/spermidine oxidase-like n=1 Tax=Lytechinus pictus TaxID=7653 RepID=UPI0030BA17A6
MEEMERIPKPRLSVQSEQPTSTENMSVRPSIQVCIIGAGLAGLSAAEALILRSKECDGVDIGVTVLEAMDRPGGRAVTLKLGDKLVEGGAQFIHGCEGNPVYHRARQHKLKLSNYNPRHCTYNISQGNGKRVPESIFSEVAEIYDAILLKTQAGMYREERKGCGDKTVGEFMKRYFEKYFARSAGSPQEKEIKANVFRLQVINECCYSACNHLNDLMLQDFGEYKEILGNVTFADGYNQFVETFLKNIPTESLVYNKPVEQITWRNVRNDEHEGKSMTITCKDGDQFEADYVIVTTSLGYLKEHAVTMFNPPLPTPKLDLISRMGFGTAGKIWLEYETPFWSENWGGIYLVWDAKPSDVMMDEFKEDEWYKYFYTIQRIPDRSNLLKVWTFGKSAEYIETLDNDIIAKTLTDVLREFLKNPTIPLPVNVYKTGWFNNPYVRGAYSYVAAGSSGADIDALAEPVCIPGKNGLDRPAICFAGEATHRTFYSTTHGAMLSGQREAGRIISDVKLCASSKPVMYDNDENIPKKVSIDVNDMMENLAAF